MRYVLTKNRSLSASTIPVAAAEGCVRLRSSRQSWHLGLPGIPRWL